MKIIKLVRMTTAVPHNENDTIINESLQYYAMQNNSSVFDSTKLGALIHLLEVAMKIGKYLPVIIASFAGLNIVLAVNDFLVSNTGFGILNSIFAMGGFIFLVQLHHRRKIHS